MHRDGELLGGRYRLERRIASGGMGEVWRAVDERLGRAVAVKIMLPALLDDPGFAARFHAEARAMATVSHPAVVEIHDYHSDPPPAFLVMQYVEGEPLTRVLAREGRLRPARTMSLIAQAADGLHAVHEKRIVHRDVKPGNLLLAAGDRLMLADFGISRSEAATRLTAPDRLIGTAVYMSPEQAEYQPVTPASDVYSLGVVAYECLVGRPPFAGGTPVQVALQHVRDEPPTMPPDIPAPVLEVVERALAKNPADRWPTAQAFATAARAAAARCGSPQLAPPPQSGPAEPWPPAPARGGPPPRPRGWLRRPAGALVVAGAIAAAVVAAVAIVIPAMSGDDPEQGSGTLGAEPAGAGGDPPVATSAAADPDAAVPSAFLGAWEGTVSTGDGVGGEQLRRVVIEQGAVGGELTEITTVTDQVLCDGTGTLTSASDSAIELDPTISLAIPEHECGVLGRSPLTLELSGQDRLRWAATSLAGTLTRVSESPDGVPEQYLGTWTGTVTLSSGSDARAKTIVIEAGPLGEDLVTATTSADDFYCETNGILVSIEDGIVFFSHQVTEDSPPGSCRAVGLQTMVPQADGSMRWSAEDYSGTLTRD